MLQIFGWMGCVLLVFKGFQILIIALSSSREDRQNIILAGALALIISIGAAFAFFTLINKQVEKMENETNKIGDLMQAR